MQLTIGRCIGREDSQWLSPLYMTIMMLNPFTKGNSICQYSPVSSVGVGSGHVAEFIINPRFEDRQSIARAVRTK
jgi:hypothetical protein